jgi:hypothetical protein
VRHDVSLSSRLEVLLLLGDAGGGGSSGGRIVLLGGSMAVEERNVVSVLVETCARAKEVSRGEGREGRSVRRTKILEGEPGREDDEEAKGKVDSDLGDEGGLGRGDTGCRRRWRERSI